MNINGSLFNQTLAIIDRGQFSKIVYHHQADKHAKGFTCWEQFVSLLFCQLAQAHSLREISGGLASCEGKLKHLGLNAAPNKSTLSYVNAHRPWEVFRDLFFEVLKLCQNKAKTVNRKFRFKNKLYSLDSTTISLCLSMFDWAKYRQTKGAVKLHMLLDHDGYLPTFATPVQNTFFHKVASLQDLVFAI